MNPYGNQWHSNTLRTNGASWSTLKIYNHMCNLQQRHRTTELKTWNSWLIFVALLVSGYYKSVDGVTFTAIEHHRIYSRIVCRSLSVINMWYWRSNCMWLSAVVTWTIITEAITVCIEDLLWNLYPHYLQGRLRSWIREYLSCRVGFATTKWDMCITIKVRMHGDCPSCCCTSFCITFDSSQISCQWWQRNDITYAYNYPGKNFSNRIWL